MSRGSTWAVILLLGGTGLISAQQFPIFGKRVQIHGFIAQGFAHSGSNNFLTMNTSDGSFAFTDGGLNMSVNLTDRFRVGAQGYARNIGRLGNGHPTLDWAYGDYRFADWFGVRAGKVKTALGLYNDTQDMEALHTWAVLPQSVYPLDLRSSTIAHVGADIYGEVSLKRLGSIAYTAYGGARPDDTQGGRAYVLGDYGAKTTKKITGHMAGGDLRWTTPLPGLVAGSSFSAIAYKGSAYMQSFRTTMDFETKTDNINAFYADYQRSNLHFSAEYRRNWEVAAFKLAVPVRIPDLESDQRSWYLSGSYRVAKRLELGSYYSSFVYNAKLPSAPDSNHIYDKVITARVDLTRMWNVKLEGHFMDGYGAPQSSHGFYRTDNPAGLKPTTNMLVVRTGFSF